MRQSAWLVFFLLLGITVSAKSATVKPAPATATAATPATASTVQAPAHPVTVEQVQQILALTSVGNMKQQMLDGMLPFVQQMLPYMPDNVVDDFRHSLEMADFDAALVHTFQAHLSTEDATQIIAFYKTPAGRRMIGVMPLIETEGQQAGAELGQQVMLQVIERHQTELDAAKKKYQQEHTVGSPQS
ncbi:MAG: DUF2059 domain-containing protein [Acidobacteriaceae bacterium]